MKKLLSLVCALMMFASLATPAFAAEAPPAEDPAVVAEEPLPPVDEPEEEAAEEEPTAQEEEPAEEESQPTEEGDPPFAGTGTVGDPYQIASSTDLVWLGEAVNSGALGAQGNASVSYGNQNVYYELTADINLSSIENWTPIGGLFQNDDRTLYPYAFKGNFDGKGYKISNLNQTITSAEPQNAGLFGYLENANISNVLLESGSININVGVVSLYDPIGKKDYNYTYNAGALAGEASGSKITGCHNLGVDVTSGQEPAGGLVGWATDNTKAIPAIPGSTISLSSNHAEVQNTSAGAATYTGGIVGHTQNALISQCANYGSIGNLNSATYTGGIAGWINSTPVRNSLNTGNIQGGKFSGGIAGGANMNDNSIEFLNCYSTGDVLTKHTNHQLGGIVGYTMGEGSIVGCVAMGGNIGRADTNSYKTVGRIAGLRDKVDNLYTDKNYGYTFMLRSGVINSWAADGTTVNGDGVTDEFRSESFWKTALMYSSTIWEIDATEKTLPQLKGVLAPDGGASMPEYPERPTRIIEQRINGTVLNEMTYTSGSKGWVFTLQWKDTLGEKPVDAEKIRWDVDDDGTGGASLGKTITPVKSGTKVVGQKRSLTIAPNWAGTVQVHVTEEGDESGFTKTFTINITSATATGIKLEPSSQRIASNGYALVEVTSTPASSRLEDNAWQLTKWEVLGNEDGIVTEDPHTGAAGQVQHGLIANEKEGTVTVKVTGKLNNKEVSATCTVTVAPKLTGIKLMPQYPDALFVGESLQFTAAPVPAGAVLPDDLKFNIGLASPADTFRLDEDIEGLVHAEKVGTANMTASSASAGLTSNPVMITANGAPTQIELNLRDTASGISAAALIDTQSTEELDFHPTIGGILEIEAAVSAQISVQTHTFTSDNPSVLRFLRISDIENSTAEFEIRAAGTANITVNYAGRVSRSLRVVVPPAGAGAPTTLAFGQSKVQVAANKTAFSIPFSCDSSSNLTFDWFKADDKSSIESTAIGISEVKFDEVDSELDISAGSAFVPGRYILRVRLGGLMTECRVDILPVDTFATTTDLTASYRLATAKATLYTNSTVSAVRLPLTVGADGKPANLSDTGKYRLDFVPSRAADAGHFKVTAVDNNTIQIDFDKADPAQRPAAKKYTGKLEIRYTGGGENVLLATVKETLTITVDGRKYPSLKAPALNLNCYYSTPGTNNSVDMQLNFADITGGEVTMLELNTTKRTPAPIWGGNAVTFSVPNGEQFANISLPYSTSTRKTSGTVYLLATIKNWRGGDEYKAPVAVKVSRIYTAPALKLSTTAPKIYLGETTGTPMTLKAKSSKESLLTLGVMSIAVPASNAPGVDAGIYKNQDDFLVSSLNRSTGAFTLSQTVGSAWDKAKNTKLLLRVQVYDYASKTLRSHDMAVKVSPIAATTKVSLKASKTSLTLNPNMQYGDSFDIILSTNIAGYQLANRGAGNNLSLQLLDSKGKDTLDPDKTPINAYLMGTTLRVQADHSTESWAFNKSFKLKLTLPNAYEDSKGKVQPATLNITVKTQKQSTDGKKYMPALKFTPKGKVNLTTGAQATLNLTISNINGSIYTLSVDDFDISRVVGKGTVALTDSEKKAFNLVQQSEKSWLLSANKPSSELAPEDYLLPGKYKFKLKASILSIIDATCNEFTVTVEASKPKLTLTPKAATLHRSDAESYALVRISPPVGSGLNIAKVVPQKADNTPYTVVHVQGTEYVLVSFKDGLDDTARLRAGKKTITLNVWMDGIRLEDSYAEGKPDSKATTTVKLTIDPKF